MPADFALPWRSWGVLKALPSVQQYTRATRALLPFLVALGCGFLALALFRQEHMLLLSIALSTAILVAHGKTRQWTPRST